MPMWTLADAAAGGGSTMVVDGVALALVAGYAVFGLVRGFWRQSAGPFVVLLLGVLGATLLAHRAGAWLRAEVWGKFSEGVARMLAFVLVLLALLAIGSLIAHLVKKQLSKRRPAPYDRVLGGLFGGLKGALLVFALVLGLVYALGTGADAPGWMGHVASSRTGRLTRKAVETVDSLLPDHLARALLKYSDPLR